LVGKKRTKTLFTWEMAQQHQQEKVFTVRTKGKRKKAKVLAGETQKTSQPKCGL